MNLPQRSQLIRVLNRYTYGETGLSDFCMPDVFIFAAYGTED